MKIFVNQNRTSKFLLGVLVVTIGFFMASCVQNTADEEEVIIVANGNIITMNPDQPTATAMAVKGGEIIAVGNLSDVKKVAGNSYEYVELEGKTVVPGFIESHDHMVQYGAVLEFLDITPFACPTLAEALHKLKQQGKPDEDGWIYAWAIDQTLYEEKRGPTIQELDELFPDIPVCIFHMSGHGAYVNSKAFELKGITKDTPDPAGGNFEKDENGELTGYLNGQPAALMVAKLPPVTRETTYNSAAFHAEHGFTTTTELAIMHPNMLQLMEAVTQEPGFPVRVYGGMFVTMPGLEEVAPQIENYETDLFKVPFIKTWTDGSTQGGTGYFTEPYYKLDADTKKGARGLQENFDSELTTMLELGFAPGIHANGDAAMDLALNAIEFARKKTGRSDIRPHLIHCQYVRDDQFDRIQEMGNIGMTFFTPHVYFWGDMHRDLLLGEERASEINAMNKAIERNIPYGIHNDPPVSPPIALHAMWVAVNRLTSSGKVLGPDQRITPEQALKAYTCEAAVVLGIEDKVGSLEPGKYADFVVLSENPLEVDPMKIKDIQVLATVMNGEVTYQVVTRGIYHH
ncbi:amidohydrolase [uncultured Draconibacterium sp.]|uniref:amidohydrolase n=1 Tax=uncultured Draconibacterium sp. TaxID=1573823 RepID=UPI002AA65AA1|nr:amidohydrolase [uncultured Draconibacterium sp.]